MENLGTDSLPAVHFTDSQVVSKVALPSRRDVALFLQLIEGGARLQLEDHDGDDHLNQVIDKPWGYEYRVYADSFYDAWRLTILPGHQTSLHCHPRKETSLLCLRGTAKVRMLNQTRIIGVGEHVHFHRGVFHSTENIGASELELVEVEAPRNKLDLVRLADRYGRARQSYERRTAARDVPPLLGCPAVPTARIRAMDIAAQHRFGVQLGREVKSNGLLFALDLGLGAAFDHVIHVLRGSTDAVARVDQQALYLTFHHNNQAAEEARNS